MPSPSMLQAGTQAPLGDDVFGEDPSVLQLEEFMADLFGKQKALYVPTGTMANLVAILAHCHTRASEIMVGSGSHIFMWEGGGAANLGGVHAAQIPEDKTTGRLVSEDIRDNLRTEDDDHWPQSKLLCLENTHNMCGGIAFPPSYLDEMSDLAHELGLSCHVDGARIFNAIVAHQTTAREMCESVDSVSICLSKGLGAPLGSVLVGDANVIRLAKRARKRCGGGMCQAGVVAAMGLYAVEHNVQRLQEDHERAQRLGKALWENGFEMLRQGQVDTNIVYFALPKDSSIATEALISRLAADYGVRIGGGYSRGGKYFRAVAHMQIDDEGIDRAIEGILQLGTNG